MANGVSSIPKHRQVYQALSREIQSGKLKRGDKLRIFLGSSGKQVEAAAGVTRGLEEVAHVEPWTDVLQSWDHHPGAASSSSRMKSTSPRSCSLRTTGRQPACPYHPLRDPVRRLRETMSSSKPAFSVESSACAEPSSSMRAARSFRAISSDSREYGMAKRRPLPR